MPELLCCGTDVEVVNACIEQSRYTDFPQFWAPDTLFCRPRHAAAISWDRIRTAVGLMQI